MSHYRAATNGQSSNANSSQGNTSVRHNTSHLKERSTYGDEYGELDGKPVINFFFFVDYKNELDELPKVFRADIEKKITQDAKAKGSLMDAVFSFFANEYGELAALSSEELALLEYTDKDILDEAKAKATKTRERIAMLLRIGALPPTLKERTELFKQTEERYWRRKLRRRINRLSVHASNLLALIGVNAPHRIAAPNIKKRFLAMQERSEQFKSKMLIWDGTGQPVSLAEVATTYGQRMAESLCIMNALERLAEERGHTWSFITLTLPPRLHPNPALGRQSWDRTPVYKSVEYINERWRRIRAMFAKSKIRVNGVRVAEAHEDGCFHNHILLFHDAAHYNAICRIVKHHFNESEHQAKIALNNGKAKATSYAFKYIQKSNTVHDSKGNDSAFGTNSSERGKVIANQALRSACGVRALAWLGIPKGTITKWRLLGRARRLPACFIPLDQLVKGRDFLGVLRLNRAIEITKSMMVNAYGESKQKITGLAFKGVQWIKQTFSLFRSSRLVTVIQHYPRLAEQQTYATATNFIDEQLAPNPPPVISTS